MGSENKEIVEKINSVIIRCLVLFTEWHLFTVERLLMKTLEFI